MHTIAAGVAIHWAGIDGWLYFLAALAFALAALAAAGKGGRLASNAVMFAAIGLCLWVLTNIITGG